MRFNSDELEVENHTHGVKIEVSLLDAWNNLTYQKDVRLYLKNLNDSTFQKIYSVKENLCISSIPLPEISGNPSQKLSYCIDVKSSTQPNLLATRKFTVKIKPSKLALALKIRLIEPNSATEHIIVSTKPENIGVAADKKLQAKFAFLNEVGKELDFKDIPDEIFAVRLL